MKNDQRDTIIRFVISHSQHVQCKCLSDSLTIMISHFVSLLDFNDQSWNKNRDKARNKYCIENFNIIETFIMNCVSDTIRESDFKIVSLSITSTCLSLCSLYSFYLKLISLITTWWFIKTFINEEFESKRLQLRVKAWFKHKINK